MSAGGLNTADEATRDYFRHIHELLETTRDETEESLLVDKALLEVEKQPMPVICDKRCSKALELVILRSNASQVMRLLLAMKGKILDAAYSANASHLLESVLFSVPNLLQCDSESERETMISSVIELVNEMRLGDFAEHMADRYCCHVIAMAVRLLSGERVELSSKKSATESSERKLYSAPRQCRKLYKELLQWLLSQSIGWFAQMALETYAVHVFCAFLETAKSSQWKSLVDRLLLSDADRSEITLQHVQSLMSHRTASHLLQCILRTCGADFYHDFYVRFLRNQLFTWCEHNIANYVIQEAIAATKDEPHADMIMEELLPHIPNFLGFGDSAANQQHAASRGGIVLKLCDMAVRLGKKVQKILFKSIVRAVTSAEEAFSVARKQSVYCLIHLHKPEEQMPAAHLKMPRGQSRFSKIGCRILQSILLFDVKVAQPLWDGMLALSLSDLHLLALDSAGNHVLEQFLLTAPATLRSRLTRLLESCPGGLVDLACDKCGSHVVDKCYIQGSMEDKEFVAQRLLSAETRLSGNTFGRIVMRNCKVLHYKNKRESWADQESGAQKKRKMFAEFDNSAAKEENVKKRRGIVSDDEADDNDDGEIGRERWRLDTKGVPSSGSNAIEIDDDNLKQVLQILDHGGAQQSKKEKKKKKRKKSK